MIGAAVVLIASGAAAFSGLIPLPGGDGAEAAGEAGHEAGPAAASGTGHGTGHGEPEAVATLEDIVVDITARTVSGEPARRFLKARLALVYPGEDAAGRGAARLVHLRDAFTDYLRQLDERDLSGSAGLALLRADLLHRARVVLGPDAPLEVLVSDLVVQ